MSYWNRLLWIVSRPRAFTALGGLFALLGALQTVRNVQSDDPLLEVLLDIVLFATPAVVLLVAGYRIRRSDLPPRLYTRITAWCIGGMCVMLAVTGILALNPDASLGHPLREVGFHIAIGSVSGLAVGVMETRALSESARARSHEQALEESKQELQTLIELLPVAVFVAEGDGEIVEWNDAAIDIWGGEIVESNSVAEYDQYEAYWADTGEPVDPEEWPLARALKGEAVTDPAEINIKGFDGELRTVLNHGMPVRDADGEVSRAVVTLVDITDQKERERDLELFRTLLDHSTDSLLVVDPDTGRFLDVNDTACRRRGYAREEFLELTVPDLDTNMSDLDEWHASVDDMQNQGTYTLECRHRRKDGSTYPVEINAAYVELDREYVIALARDVTERRERERERRRMERRFQAIFQDPNILVGLLDTDGTVLDVNQTAMEYNDADLADVTGESFWEMPWWGEDEERAVDVREWVERAASGEYVEFETEVLGPDGGRYHIDGAFRPVVDEDGDVISVIVSDRDVTERREYERKLEASNERLEQFAYGASHDLQEPLRMVSSYLRLIEQRYADELDEDGLQFLEFAVDGAERMQEMIEGLLEYSRVDTRGEPLVPIDLDAVLADVRNDLQVRIRETNAEIAAADLPRVVGDASQLRQLFQNLLENAIKYSGDERPRVTVSAERASDEWVIAVSDEGIGIDPDHAERVFEVFQSLHAPEEHDGTGIGLALCTRIVERHGGDIWVESEPGEGSTFYFTLPVRESAADESVESIQA